MLCVGEKAPDFSSVGDDGAVYSLSSFKGKNVILYFYPKDDTPGCTMESCGFRDLINEFESLNAVVVGVSRDSVSSHRRFKEKYDLPFLLLSDEAESLCAAYDVMGEKKMYGKTYKGILRSTFLINPEGTLASVWYDTGVSGHVEDVLSLLKRGEK